LKGKRVNQVDAPTPMALTLIQVEFHATEFFYLQKFMQLKPIFT
jgi:hypothetical protein